MSDFYSRGTNRMSLINILLPLSMVIMSTYNIVVGRAIEDEHKWASLVPTLAVTATLSHDQVNQALMTPGTPRDVLISFGSWHHDHTHQGEQFTFSDVTRNQCRGLMRLWEKQGATFPLEVVLNHQDLGFPSEGWCRGADLDPQRTLTLTARAR